MLDKKSDLLADASFMFPCDISVIVFCTDKNRVIKIVRFSFDRVLWTINHIMIYPDLVPFLKLIGRRPVFDIENEHVL
jgi:hypothetical protein